MWGGRISRHFESLKTAFAAEYILQCGLELVHLSLPTDEHSTSLNNDKTCPFFNTSCVIYRSESEMEVEVAVIRSH